MSSTGRTRSRHEVFNEAGRERVIQDLVEWLGVRG
jgi:hypothetical protein